MGKALSSMGTLGLFSWRLKEKIRRWVMVVIFIIISAGTAEGVGAESVYKVIEFVGTSAESWEKAAAAAVERAEKSLRDLRIGEVAQLDVQVANGKVELYRAKVKVSFKYDEGSQGAAIRSAAQANA